MKNKFLIVFMLFVVLSLLMVGCSQFLENSGVIPSDREEEAVADKSPLDQGMVRVIIGFSKPPQAAEQALIKSFGGEIKTTYRIIPAIAAQVPSKALEALKKNPVVTEIEMDTLVYAYDVELDNCWGVKRIGAGIAHDHSYFGDGVKVAVIDTGIDDSHPELSVTGYYDFVNDSPSNPSDIRGHGTHVAGIIAAAENNTGAVGVAPQAYLYDLKALGDDGSGYISDIIEAIQWASDPNGDGSASDRLDIINMSLGAPVGNYFLRWACNLAYRDGLLLVAAAGNEDGGPVGYPAAYDTVMAVSATNSLDGIASFSSVGPQVELAAPGQGIYSTIPSGGYAAWSGTSMACPHVVGAAALVWASNPGWSNEQVRNQLTSTAEDIGLSSNEQGYGLVDCDAALGIEDSGDTTPPAQVTGLTANAVSANQIDLYWTPNAESDFRYYKIYRDDNFPVNSTSNSYTDASLSSSTKYCYQVSAVDSSGNEGIQSEQVYATTKDDPITEDTMHIQNIGFAKKGSNLFITITVIDGNNLPLSDVAVEMHLALNGTSSGSWDFSGKTDSEGKVAFKLSKVKSGTYTATVTSLILSGYTWDNTADVNNPATYTL